MSWLHWTTTARHLAPISHAIHSSIPPKRNRPMRSKRPKTGPTSKVNGWTHLRKAAGGRWEYGGGNSDLREGVTRRAELRRIMALYQQLTLASTAVVTGLFQEPQISDRHGYRQFALHHARLCRRQRMSRRLSGGCGCHYLCERGLSRNSHRRHTRHVLAPCSSMVWAVLAADRVSAKKLQNAGLLCCCRLVWLCCGMNS